MMKEFNNFPYEVRFLRAFYYFELIKRYHDVPLVTTVLTQDEVNNLKRESCDLVADFIVKELTEITAEGKLPITYTEGFASKDIGRITRGAALALKSRVTLYMASPPIRKIMPKNGRKLRPLLMKSSVMFQSWGIHWWMILRLSSVK